jgi:hypothetical protein
VITVAVVNVLVMEVVNVPVMPHLDVAAALAVLVVVPLGGHVAGGLALVVVPVVAVVQMAVVDVIDVSDMFKRFVPAVRPMYVGVLAVDRVRSGIRRHAQNPSSLVFPQVGAGLPAQAAAQPGLVGLLTRLLAQIPKPDARAAQIGVDLLEDVQLVGRDVLGVGVGERLVLLVDHLRGGLRILDVLSGTLTALTVC